MTKQGEFNWNELQTRDASAAIEFYKSTIGWTFEAEQMPSGGTYWIASAAGEPVCGVLTLDRGDVDPSDRWVTYVHIDDIDEAIAKVTPLGGLVLRSPWDVPGVGRVAMVRDPGGAELGWVRPS